MHADPSLETEAASPASRRSDPPGASAFSAGDALARAGSIFGRNVLVLFALAALFQAIPTLIDYQGTKEALARTPPTRSPMSALHMLLSVLLSFGFQSVVTYAVFQTLRGRNAGWGTSLARGMRRLLPALGTGLLVGLGLGIVPGIATMLAFALGPLGLVIAGVISAVWIGVMGTAWYVSVQVAVVEAGGSKAVQRSADLTRGARWKVFGVLLVTYALPFVAIMTLQMAVLPQEGRGVLTPSGLTVMPGAWQWPIFAMAAFQALFSSFQAVAASVVYHDLRRAKEGVEVADLVTVFE